MYKKQDKFIESLLNDFKRQEEKKYGFSFLALELKNANGKIFLEGKVLTQKQKQRLLEILEKHKIKIPENLKIVSDPQSRLEIGWGSINSKLVNVFNQPKSRFPSEQEANNSRNTQLLFGDIVRVLGEFKTYFLIQKNDFTVGWIPKEKLTLSDKLSPKSWQRIKRATANKVFSGSADRMIKKAESFLGVPYLLGGVTDAGLDCSGLVQISYWQAEKILLPKNSRDQLFCGKSIDLEKAKRGDLIFLEPKKKGFHHVGIYLGNDQIIHASYRMKKVVIWDLNILWKIYKLVGVRRIIK